MTPLPRIICAWLKDKHGRCVSNEEMEMIDVWLCDIEV